MLDVFAWLCLTLMGVVLASVLSLATGASMIVCLLIVFAIGTGCIVRFAIKGYIDKRRFRRYLKHKPATDPERLFFSTRR